MTVIVSTLGASVRPFRTDPSTIPKPHRRTCLWCADWFHDRTAVDGFYCGPVCSMRHIDDRGLDEEHPLPVVVAARRMGLRPSETTEMQAAGLLPRNGTATLDDVVIAMTRRPALTQATNSGVLLAAA
ncbi:MAG: hypothetical protein ABS81_07405 [Pseudonocardia sp. SCN 72-86]|nr:MAG: hypothetical protein ABS81_07405 [Pseudonocardia sp. SCN 72-86]